MDRRSLPTWLAVDVCMNAVHSALVPNLSPYVITLPLASNACSSNEPQ